MRHTKGVSGQLLNNLLCTQTRRDHHIPPAMSATLACMRYEPLLATSGHSDTGLHTVAGFMPECRYLK